MPLLRKAILKPIVGLNFEDPSTMISDRGGFPTNMRLYRNWLKKREGKILFGDNAISGSVLHVCQYALESLSVRLVRFSQRNAEKYNPTTDHWDDITGANFTGGVDNFFSTCVAENQLVISNYIDIMRTYNDIGNTANLVATSGIVPRAKFIEYNEAGYLIAAFTDAASGGPTRVQWADIGDITRWGSGNAGAKQLRHTPDPIRALKNLKGYTVAYKKDSIYLGRPVDTADIIKWDLEWTNVGLMSNRALVAYRGRHYFMGTDDFYVYNGASLPESIGIDTVKREVFGRLNRDKAERCFALLMEEYDEVWFFIVLAGNDWPTEIWKFNYRTGYWYYDTCDELTSACIYFRTSALTVDELPGLVDDLPFVIDDALLTTDFPLAVVGNVNGITRQCNPMYGNDGNNDVPIDGYWESMDFAADKFEEYKRWLQLDYEAKGNNLVVSYSTDFGVSWKDIPINNLGNTLQPLTTQWTTYRIYFDVVAQYIRFRFRNANLSETFFLRQFYPYWLHREEVNR